MLIKKIDGGRVQKRDAKTGCIFKKNVFDGY